MYRGYQNPKIGMTTSTCNLTGTNYFFSDYKSSDSNCMSCEETVLECLDWNQENPEGLCLLHFSILLIYKVIGLLMFIFLYYYMSKQ